MVNPRDIAGERKKKKSKKKKKKKKRNEKKNCLNMVEGGSDSASPGSCLYLVGL